MKMSDLAQNGEFWIEIDGESVRAAAGTPLGQLLERRGGLSMPCGGMGRCGKCRVLLSGLASPPEEAELRLLSEEERKKGVRLACRVRLEGPCRVRLLREEAPEILLETGREPAGNRIFPPLFKKLGAAVDIGTTTLAASLYDESGRIAQAGLANPQASFGADVISRIEKSLSGEGQALAASVVQGIECLLEELADRAGRRAAAIDAVVITGNTAMLYLLTRRNPQALSRAPFAADWLAGEWMEAKDLGFASLNAKVYLPPCISAFVGADITTALLATDMGRDDRVRMLADIGTNGEVVLQKGGRLLCCSTAAGPAFEGAGLSMGMQGRPGAISHVEWNGSDFAVQVIGNVPASGICGSGVIDAVNALRESGQMDETGYLEEGEAYLTDRVKLTQEDIRKVQLAKSAVCAGMKAMLDWSDTKTEELSELLVAGGFGSSVNLENAAAIGLILPLAPSSIRVCGNAALTGAAMLLTGEKGTGEACGLVQKAETVNLAANPVFQEAYIEGMYF
mgnify:FL=1